jgi:CheY-like chemotaxis protein
MVMNNVPHDFRLLQSGSPKLFLCIDDDEDDLDFFEEAVRAVGMEHLCIKSLDGITGLKVLQGMIPDYIFLDINMPAMDGLTVLDQIRQQDHLREVPVIILSTSIQNPKDCLRRGATACWKKANSLGALVKQLKKFFFEPQVTGL